MRRARKSMVAGTGNSTAPRESGAVCVEYPCEHEVIQHPYYTFRVAAVPEAAHVAVSVDRGEWKPCRESLGLWWYDWNGYVPGEHEVVARIQKDKGIFEQSGPRHFVVRKA